LDVIYDLPRFLDHRGAARRYFAPFRSRNYRNECHLLSPSFEDLEDNKAPILSQGVFYFHYWKIGGPPGCKEP